MKPVTRISLAAALILLVLFPLAYGQLMAAALTKLQLDRRTALALLIAIMCWGPSNIPVKRIRTEEVAVHCFAVFGLADF